MSKGKFRGKDIETGEWRYGYYVCLNDKEHRIYSGYAETDCGDYYPDFWKVDPETVCESTELFAGGVKEIFEGDIVLFDEKIWEVRRECDTPGCYWAETGFILKQIGVDCTQCFTDTIDDFFGEICVQIIGNKFDNKDLMKRRKEK